MRPLYFVVTFIAILLIGTSLPSRAQSQPEMTAQSWAEFDKADKELNEVYQKVLKSMDDDIGRQKLVAAQKAWVKFRDAQAELDADSERGGSLANQVMAISETDMTKARIAELKQYLADQTAK
jgi:uncharacterized protein YecT (DUF1311 family)